MATTVHETQHETAATTVTAPMLAVFRKAMAQHAENHRKQIDSQEHFLNKLAKSEDPTVQNGLALQTKQIGQARADLSDLESKWNIFNEALENINT